MINIYISYSEIITEIKINENTLISDLKKQIEKIIDLKKEFFLLQLKEERRFIYKGSIKENNINNEETIYIKIIDSYQNINENKEELLCGIIFLNKKKK
jgi:hypothetical protein